MLNWSLIVSIILDMLLIGICGASSWFDLYVMPTNWLGVAVVTHLVLSWTIAWTAGKTKDNCEIWMGGWQHTKGFWSDSLMWAIILGFVVTAIRTWVYPQNLNLALFAEILTFIEHPAILKAAAISISGTFDGAMSFWPICIGFKGIKAVLNA
jgi:hypothetical protein